MPDECGNSIKIRREKCSVQIERRGRACRKEKIHIILVPILLFGMEVLMMKIGTDQKNCICQKGRSRRGGQTGCRGIIGIKTEQRAEYTICFVMVLVIKVEGLQIGKKLSEPVRADRGTDGRGRGKGGLIEQRGSFFSGKFHPGIFPWIPRVRIIVS